MSSCPRRYASKSIRTLTHSNPLLPTPEPQWFLYPPWFRADSPHQYHTEPGRGQGRLRIRQKKQTSQKVANVFSGREDSDCRYYHFSRKFCDQSTDRTADAPPGKTDAANKARPDVERTVLHGQRVFRKVVPSTTWISKPEHIPEQRKLERRARYIRDVNPKMLMALLRSFPPEPSRNIEAILRMPLPEGGRDELMPSFVKSNTWRHHDGTNCMVTYEAGNVELHGSTRAQEVAQKYFSEIGHYARSQEYLDWSNSVLHASYSPVADLSRPPTWTVRSFFDYVRFVTRPRFRRSAQRHIYNEDDSHHRAVLRILIDIFTDPQSRPFVSTAALRLALSYCRKHTEHPRTASNIWTAFLETGLTPDVECFNQEIGRCLVSKEFHRLCQRVAEMKELGVRPDSTTWSLVMQYTEQTSDRATVLELAREAELPNLDSHSSIVVAMAKKEISRYPGTQDGVQRFIARMDHDFGADWLTSHVLQRLLRAGRVGKARIGLVSELLLALRKAGKEALIDHRCVMELIELARRAGDLDEALKLVKMEALSPIADIPQATIQVLFQMAWDRKHFNICRFFWLLAATSGRITFKMQRLVRSSLTRNVTRVEDPVAASWEVLAGKVIIGTNLATQGFSRMFPALSTVRDDTSPKEWLLDWVPDGQLRNEQVQLGQLLVERDLHAFRFYERLQRSDFLTCLDEAIALDAAWKISEAAITMSPRELIARSLEARLVERAQVLPYTGPRNGPNGPCFIVGDHKLDYNTLQYGEEPTEQPSNQLEDALKVNDPHTGKSLYLQSSINSTDPSPSRRETAIDAVEEQNVAWQGFG